MGRVLGFLQLPGQIRNPRLKLTLLIVAQVPRPRVFGLTLLELLGYSLPVVCPFLSVQRRALELLTPVFQLLKSVLLIVEFGLLLSDSLAQA